jgi:hypothetical protein
MLFMEKTSMPFEPEVENKLEQSSKQDNPSCEMKFEWHPPRMTRINFKNTQFNGGSFPDGIGIGIPT